MMSTNVMSSQWQFLIPKHWFIRAIQESRGHHEASECQFEYQNYQILSSKRNNSSSESTSILHDDYHK